MKLRPFVLYYHTHNRSFYYVTTNVGYKEQKKFHGPGMQIACQSDNEAELLKLKDALRSSTTIEEIDNILWSFGLKWNGVKYEKD